MRSGLAALLFVALCALPVVAEAPWIDEKTFEDDAGRSYKVKLGRIEIPAVRADPDSGKVSIAFARVYSPAATPGTPVIYLAGGPGFPATPKVRNPQALSQWAPILERSDMIFVDQRGTGLSEPVLTHTVRKANPSDLFLSEESAKRFVLEAGGEALAAFREKGIDLRGYTTEESADDIATICRAIALEKVDLFGFSYGTHLGLAVLKRHPSLVNSAVLIGVEGLDETYKEPWRLDAQLRKVSLLAARDPGTAAAGDLETLLRRVLSKLEKKPLAVRVTDPRSREEVYVPVGPFGLKLIIRFDIGDSSDLTVLPRLLSSIDAGDSSVLQWFVQKRYRMFSQIPGVTMLMDPASGASPERLAAIERQAGESLFGNVSNFPFPAGSDAWPVTELGDDFRRPVISDTRVLLLSGTLDWNAPPYQAERVRWGFPNASHIIVGNAGHEQILTHPAIFPAIVRFLAGDDVSNVTATHPPIRFVALVDGNGTATHPSVSKGR